MNVTTLGNIHDSDYSEYLKYSRYLWVIRTIINGISRRILRVSGLLGKIVAFQQKTGFRGANHFDYLFLYAYVRIFKPQCILELGSGVSTYIVSMALYKNGSGLLTTLDQSREWQHRLDHIPMDQHRHIKMYISKCIQKQVGNIVGVGYQDLPDLPYDFVIVDGPDASGLPLLNVDYLELCEKGVKPFCYIASRFRTGFYYRFILGRVWVSPIFKCSFVFRGK